MNEETEKKIDENKKLPNELKPRSLLRIFVESFVLFLLSGLIGWITLKLMGKSL